MVIYPAQLEIRRGGKQSSSSSSSPSECDSSRIHHFNKILPSIFRHFMYIPTFSFCYTSSANPAQTSSSEDSSQERYQVQKIPPSHKEFPSTPLTSENSLEKAESAAKALAVADSKVFEAKEASQVADTAPKKL
ncbi:unnamed protein product, partial [Brassica rapa]